MIVAAKAHNICEMEPLSILLKMACKNTEDPDEHVMPCMRTLQHFGGGGHTFGIITNFGILGAFSH